MKLELDLNKLDLDGSALERLKRCFNTVDEDELISKLQDLSLAAIHEYIDMVSGKTNHSKATDFNQHRLFHLIKYFYNGKIPSEAEVASLFQLTDVQSRTLIKNVTTRYQYELEEIMEQHLKSVYASIARDKTTSDKYVIIESKHTLDELNRIIMQEDNQCVGLSRPRGKRYEISPEAEAALKKYFTTKKAV